MKRYLITVIFAVILISCNNQSKNQGPKRMNPEILAIGTEAIKINNVSDDFAYSDYTVTINGRYTAELSRMPDIERGDGIEIPLNLFGLPDGTNVSSIMFSMPGYLDHPELLEIIFPPKSPWNIMEREQTDRFGDKTGRITRGISYYGKGNFRNSVIRDGEMDVLISTEVPDVIGVAVFEYGINLVRLEDGLFSYKIGDEIIENISFKGPSLNPTGSITDETKSFLYLLKQGGTIRVQVYKDGTTYNFTIEADGFREAYSEALEGKESTITYYYEVTDRNNGRITVEFTIKYNWSLDKEDGYKNNPQLEELIRNFFRTKDRNFATDRPGGYYQSEKVVREWGEPILQQVKTLFNDDSIEYRSYSGFSALPR